MPGDETGDCQMFTTSLEEEARKLGVKFHYNFSIERLIKTNNRITGVESPWAELIEGDQFVVALGSYSRQMLKSLNIDIPVYPVKGYSLTVPITNADAAPVSTIMDETYKVAITRFDDRIRFGRNGRVGGL